MSEDRNARVQARYDELMHGGKHGHYETLFRIVREEVDRVSNKAELLQEDIDSLHMCLDERGAPRAVSGKTLSMWGRVKCLVDRLALTQTGSDHE